MKNGKKTRSGVTALLVAVLAIMAFVRGPVQIWLLAGAFILWGLWMTIPIAIAAYRKSRTRQQAKKHTPQRPGSTGFNIPDLSQPEDGVLLRHVNFRVSAYLKSAYPDVTWEWDEENPERIIAKGGIARIRLYGVPDFNYASIVFDCSANINCDMMKIVPLTELSGSPASGKAQPAPQQPSDPQVWYELQGRQILENLIADLNSRGHSSLTIKDNGDICIKQANADVTKEKLKNFPEKVYWQRLAKVFEKEGLAAAVTDAGISLSW